MRVLKISQEGKVALFFSEANKPAKQAETT